MSVADALIRPVPVYDPARSLLHNEHFQIAYVTNDPAQAEKVFRERFGVNHFRSMDSDRPAGGKVGTRSVWIGAMMYEIVFGWGPGMELYSDIAPPDGEFVLKLHHFGYLVPDEAAWTALREEIARGGWPVRLDTDMPGYCKACYVEVKELGHMLEFVLPHEGLLERMNATPVS